MSSETGPLGPRPASQPPRRGAIVWLLAIWACYACAGLLWALVGLARACAGFSRSQKKAKPVL